jgi:hypothetical protein
LRHAMKRGIPPLLEIATLWPAAEAAADAEIAARQKAKDDADPRPDFEPPGEIARDESPLTKLLFLAEGMSDRFESMLGSLPYEVKNEQRFVALLLARRCLEMYKDKEGREYRLDQKTGAALDALFDEFEDAERGFGPRENE